MRGVHLLVRVVQRLQYLLPDTVDELLDAGIFRRIQ